MTNTILESFDIWTDARAEKHKGRVRSIDNISLEGIAYLRDLILLLALRGKLVTPDSKGLSKDIEKDIKLAKKKYYTSINKNPKEYAFGKPILNEFSIPSGWKWKRVGELCDLQTGATPSTQKKEFYGGDTPWLVSGDINKKVIVDCDGRITAAGLAGSNCKILPVDTVLIALNGQGKTRATVALLKIPAACNQSLVGMIPFDSSILNSEFLTFALKYRYFEIREITGQKQRRGLNMGLVGELSIPLPPINEQIGIVAKVKELMALCDKLENEQSTNLQTHDYLVKVLLDALAQAKDADDLQVAWQQMAQHFNTLFNTEDSIEQLKQTILQLAVMGRLVKQGRNDDSLNKLQKKIDPKIAKLLKQEKVKKEKILPAVTEKEKPFELPPEWRWVRLGELCSLINGDRSKNYPNKSEYVDDGLPFINTGHILPNGALDIKEMNYISREKFNSLRSGKIIVGDLLYCLRGATMGKTALVDQFKEGAVASSLVIIRPHSSLISVKYTYNYLISPFGKELIKRYDNGTAQPNLAANSVSEFPYPLPPFEEQNLIVGKIDELFAICDAMKERIIKAEELKNHLSATIVKQALV